MTLWNIIRDFFVQYIFGGTDSQYNYYGSLIGSGASQGIDYYQFSSFDLYVPIGHSLNADQDAFIDYLSFGDWLSTTFTIITLIALCFFLFLVVRWLFRLTAGLISGRG